MKGVVVNCGTSWCGSLLVTDGTEREIEWEPVQVHRDRGMRGNEMMTTGRAPVIHDRLGQCFYVIKLCICLLYTSPSPRDS